MSVENRCRQLPPGTNGFISTFLLHRYRAVIRIQVRLSPTPYLVLPLLKTSKRDLEVL